MNRTAIEVLCLQLYKEIKYLSRIDNNDCEDITSDRIRHEIDYFDNRFYEIFGQSFEDMFKNVF